MIITLGDRLLIVTDSVGTPAFAITIRCRWCDALLAQHTLDCRTHTSESVMELAQQDGDAALAHHCGPVEFH